MPRQIIKNLDDAGILMHVFAIVGMPGETDEDALMTYRFFKRWHRQLKLDWQIYPLYVWEESPIAQRASEFKLRVEPLPDDFLVQAMGYWTKSGQSQEKSIGSSINFTEKLRGFLHPLNQIMDVQSHAMFLLVQKAKGIPPHKVRRRGMRI